MRQPEVHPMRAELSDDRATMRYSCPICERCVEDRPEGLVVVHTGDPHAMHRGGALATFEHDVEQAPPRDRLH